MERETELELLDECIDLVRSSKPFVAAEERLVPVAHYTDPERFEREQEWIFGKGTQVAAHSSQIAKPGCFVTLDVAGRPVLLVRDEAGRARAFLNVCRHRGATLELRERGQCRRFVCPYHAWSYGNDGRLASVRHREGFPSLDVEATALVELPCTEAAGLLWICPTPGTSEPAEAALAGAESQTMLAEIEALGVPGYHVFASASRDWEANWKLIVDGGHEAYHFRIAHKNSVGPFFADNISTWRFLGDHIRSVLPRSEITELVEQPRESWKLRDSTHVLYSLFPSATILVQRGHVELIRMTPLAIDRTRVEIVTLVPDPGPDGHDEKARQFWQANHDFTLGTLHEDFTLAEQIQRGMSTGANRDFRFASFEGCLSRWHDLLEAKLASREA